MKKLLAVYMLPLSMIFIAGGCASSSKDTTGPQCGDCHTDAAKNKKSCCCAKKCDCECKDQGCCDSKQNKKS